MKSLKRLLNLILTTPLIWLLILIPVAALGGYWLFGLGQSSSQRRIETVQIVATANIASEGQPVVPFAAIDPAVVDALLNDNPLSNPDGLIISAQAVPPIGIYVPAFDPELGMQFELRPQPALSPLDNQLLENFDDLPVSSAAVGTEALLEYAGDGCAPAGLPVSGVLTQRFHAYHSGIDIGVPLGTAVLATHSGDVIFAGWSSYGYGYLVIIQNGPFITYYGHLTNFNVESEDQVGAGSVIGCSGSTGNSTGPHVHYETRINDVPVDPLTFDQRGYGTC